MFHTGYLERSKNIVDINSLEWIVKKNRKNKFIFAHLGNPRVKRMGELLNKYSNLKTDISGLIEGKESFQIGKKIVKKIVKIVKNKEQILFGSDSPVQSISDTLKMIKIKKN